MSVPIAYPPIEWNRIGLFQDVTMRLIAERLLPDASDKMYVDGELISQKLRPLMPPSHGRTHHVYCSPHNPGALGLPAAGASLSGGSTKPMAPPSKSNPCVDR